MTLGEKRSVTGAPDGAFDFRTAKPIGKDINKITPAGYDHNMCVSKGFGLKARWIASKLYNDIEAKVDLKLWAVCGNFVRTIYILFEYSLNGNPLVVGKEWGGGFSSFPSFLCPCADYLNIKDFYLTI